MICTHNTYINKYINKLFNRKCKKCEYIKLKHKEKVLLCKQYHIYNNTPLYFKTLSLYFKNIPDWVINELAYISKYRLELDLRQFYKIKYAITDDHGHLTWNNYLKSLDNINTSSIIKYSNKYWNNSIYHILVKKYIQNIYKKKYVNDILFFKYKWLLYNNNNEIVSPYYYYHNIYGWIYPDHYYKYTDKRHSIHNSNIIPENSHVRRNSI